MNNLLIFGGVSAAAAGGAYWYLSANPKAKEAVVGAKDKAEQTVKGEPAKTFKGGDQGFVGLKLDSVEDVTHNTKRFRFLLDDENAVSGLKVACELLCGTTG